ncbi:T9SS type A sorting domain-containing protein, partial [Polaribacter sp.]|uniref:T9SS type A sorting domain-containing protein n=1 Tax=Polaribacter sp. TaxID=1920175 RepID=UPI003F6BC8C1
GPGNGGITGDFYIDDLKGPQLQGTASVNDFETTKFSFYPNPANNAIYFSNLDADKEVKVYDVNSKQVLRGMTNNNQLSIHNLKSGFYFVEIEGTFQKLIKK